MSADDPQAGLLLLPEREVPLGGVRNMMVRRTLPHRDLPTVGAWCFLDHFGPERTPMDVLPHPHTGLQTVTWPFEGDIRHRDSLSSDVMVRPGELNLMTSGRGVAHSEVSLERDQTLHGLQLWVALPDRARDGAAGFEHHSAPPVTEQPGLRATLLVGELLGVRSPATTFTPLLGADITLERQQRVQLGVDSTFEHAFMLIDGDLAVGNQPLAVGPLLYLPEGRPVLDLSTTNGAHFLLLGGMPFEEELVMWWNFIGRSHEDIQEARQQWESADSRFGHVTGHGQERIPAPAIPGVRLRPRRHPARARASE